MMPDNLFAEVQRSIAAGEDISEQLLAFDPSDLDRKHVDNLMSGVRRLLSRGDLAPRQLVGIAKLLLGLGRLPLPTPGLDVELRAEREDQPKWVISLNTERLYVTDDRMAVAFEVDASYRSDATADELRWLESLDNLAADCQLAVDDTSNDSTLDWDHWNGTEFWEHLPELADDDDSSS